MGPNSWTFRIALVGCSLVKIDTAVFTTRFQKAPILCIIVFGIENNKSYIFIGSLNTCTNISFIKGFLWRHGNEVQSPLGSIVVQVDHLQAFS